ncbi:MAG TPA: hypothetical protein VKU40_11740 [Thermoanaerobaculia bacterium]|nr:hypothetical protein [Thermoanaerobaculia bacterium]
MRRTSARLLALAAVFALALTTTACLGCRGDDAEDEAAIEERLDETGSFDVVEWAAQADYDPPEDGRLSEEQMEMYVAVQRRAAKIRQVARQRMEGRTTENEEGDKEIGFAAAMRAVGDLGDMMTAELRAARELDENPAEYQWVLGKVAEAQVAAVGNQARQGFARASAEMLEALEEQLEETDDADRREALREQIAELRESAGEQEEAGVSDANRHNMELYQRYRDEIEEAARENQESLDDEG